MENNGISPALSGSVLVFGCGYLGVKVAESARQHGCEVWATTRNQNRFDSFKSMGFNPILCDWTDRRTLSSLPKVQNVLVAVSYDRKSRHSRFESQVIGLQNLLSVLPHSTKLCYISTTGVYHQTDGSWVDENSPARPTREGGKAHLAAEDSIRRIRPETSCILRLSGIYGPGRVPLVRNVLTGEPIQSPASGYLNLIHVDDATRAVVSAWAQGATGLYLVSDDCPMQRRDFYREIALQCSVDPPSFVAPVPASSSLMRSSSNKRIWNRRMKRELVPQLRFPTYREGLADVLSNFEGV